jgi:Flp pilus assembly protein TadG
MGFRRTRCRSHDASHPARSTGKGAWVAWPRRLWRDEAGASMIEFSLIALPFFILLYGTFEIGFVYWANQELENAASYGARLVRTGQVQAAGLDQAQLTAQICGQTAVLAGCTTKLRLDVRSAKTLGEITAPVPLNGSGALKDAAEFSFDPGRANDVVLVTTFYSWPASLDPTYARSRTWRATSPATSCSRQRWCSPSCSGSFSACPSSPRR